MSHGSHGVSAIFNFLIRNPPMAMIGGGILLVLFSVATASYDEKTTDYLRNLAVWLIAGGFVLQALWLLFRRRW